MLKKIAHCSSFVLSISLMLHSAEIAPPAGLIRIELPPHSDTAVSQPFDSYNNSFEDTVSSQLTGSTNAETSDHVFIWNDSLQQYTDLWKNRQGEWFLPDEAQKPVISAGSAFYIRNNQSYTQQFYFWGEILIDEEYSLILSPTYAHCGYPYSTPISIEDTALSGFFDVSQMEGRKLQPGQPVWLNVPGDTPVIWVEKSPYRTDVFSRREAYPRITGIAVRGEQVSISVVNNQSLGGVDLYYQDITTNRFDPYRNWSPFLIGYGVNQKEMYVSDTLPFNIIGRYYLVTEKDAIIDSGISALPFDGSIAFSNDTSVVSDVSSNTCVLLPQTNDVSSSTNEVITEDAMEVAIRIQNGRIIYVDQQTGNDAYSGRSISVWNSHGPKKTIRSGVSTANDGDRMVVFKGAYRENIDIHKKNIRVRIEGTVDIRGK